jgi:threonine/homoserine/homoserine lactone efflux protein
LNPHTYLFWLSVGSPIVLETLKTDASATVLFLLGFYTFLIGSMTFVALVVDRSKSLVNSKYYSYVIRVLGIVLILFALAILTEGLKLMALLQ